MNSNTTIEIENESPEYPIYTVRFLAVHTLGVPTVWFVGAIAAMQFNARTISSFPLSNFFESAGINASLALVLAPIIFSVVWTAINFGQPTVQELRKMFSTAQG